MPDSVHEAHTPTLSAHESLLEKQAGTAHSMTSLKEMAEMNAVFLTRETDYKQEVGDEAGRLRRPAYELSHVPVHAIEMNRSYFESSSGRKRLTTSLRSAYTVNDVVCAIGEINEAFHQQSVQRVH